MQFMERNVKLQGEFQQNISPQGVWNLFDSDVAPASIKVPAQAFFICT